MKIVIDIPEEEYNECKNRFNTIYQEGYLNYNVDTALVLYIANGTLLEKLKERISLEKLGYPPSAGYYKAIAKVIQIIDNYKAESEEADGEA